MIGVVYVDVPRIRREVAPCGWRPTDLARVAGLSRGTMATVMKGGPVSPEPFGKIVMALTHHTVGPGLDNLLADNAA